MSSGRAGRGPTTLGPGREFDLIRSFQTALPAPGEGVIVGPGDDCVVLASGWILSTDLSVEDVHFRRDWIGLPDIGYRAVTTALSDLAAMAAEARGILVSLALPEAEVAETADGLRDGMAEACSIAACALLGGDLSRSPGPIVLDVVAVGHADRPVLRRGARPGDEVWVTGTLGASAAAVRIWGSGADPAPDLVRAFARPAARLTEARWLAEHAPMTALIDVSDGLVGDAGHIAAASGVAVELRSADVPVAEMASRATASDAEALELALTGGEDYELCFTAPAGSLDRIAQPFAEAFAAGLTRVGTVEDGEGVTVDGARLAARATQQGAFDHFSSGAPSRSAAE